VAAMTKSVLRNKESTKGVNSTAWHFYLLRFSYGWPMCAFTNYIYILIYHLLTWRIQAYATLGCWPL